MSTRRDVLAGLRDDPLGRGAVLVLGGAAVTALVLALVGVLLALIYDLRDERGELFDLEAQGAEPRTLLRHLRLRFALGLGFGVAGGIVDRDDPRRADRRARPPDRRRGRACAAAAAGDRLAARA